jgi:polyhydroxyalkanoate synthase subunit PhaC
MEKIKFSDTPTSLKVNSTASTEEAFGTAVGEWVNSLKAMSLPGGSFSLIQQSYLEEATRLWNETLQRCQVSGESALGLEPSIDVPPAPTFADRRFASDDWSRNPMAAFTAQLYLLNARTLLQMTDQIQADTKLKLRLKFAVQQWIDAMAPSNYLAFNPEALRGALDSQGKSLTRGWQHLLKDLQKGQLAQSDETAFEVGHNVATTEGAVVFENKLFQLIEYKSLTSKVFENPLLIVPPCINKFYILDLQPENSFIRYCVEQGHRVFVVSWRNPDDDLAELSWDDYVGLGVITALQEVHSICSSSNIPVAKTSKAKRTASHVKINALGFCMGGTMLSCALSVLAARGEKNVQSLTLLTSLTDFSQTGILDIFIDEAAVQTRERTIGADAPNGYRVLKGKDLATTFNMLRPNDLVWSYVVGNYLKGQTPPPFDLLYWNSDNTNLPGNMYCWYLRHTYLQNQLIQPNALQICGESLDLGRLQLPTYVYGSKEDHIVPWEGAYRNTQVLPGPMRFVLGASGHIAGVINPASKNKRSYWTAQEQHLPENPQLWMESAQERPGSWWNDWAPWIKEQAGKELQAPLHYGSPAHPVIEAAPGRYVKQKI